MGFKKEKTTKSQFSKRINQGKSVDRCPSFVEIYKVDIPGSLLSLSLPYAIVVPNPNTKINEVVRLSLNNYRNWAYISSNVYKQMYKAKLRPYLKDVKLEGKIKFVYEVIGNDNRPFDVQGVCAVVDKFFSDAVTEYGCWRDDDYKTLAEITYKFSHIDSSLAEKRIVVSAYSI